MQVHQGHASDRCARARASKPIQRDTDQEAEIVREGKAYAKSAESGGATQLERSARVLWSAPL
eukprot:5412387-Prymnesium_polylepis.2